MTKCDMEQDLKQEVQELKISIDKLSNDISQQFNSLTENLCINFEQISKQITNLSSQPSLSNKILETNLENNHQDSLEEPKKEIPREYYINYSYIDPDKYPSFLEDLEKHNKDMAECRHKENIEKFCFSANKTLESAIEVIFDVEYKFLGENNKTFLEAYQRVKTFYSNKGWEITEICLNLNNSNIESKHFKPIDDKYISWEYIEEIRRRNFNTSVEIFFEILKPNFMNSLHLREKFYLIKNIHNLRNLDAHGSSNLPLQIHTLKDSAKKLYNSKDYTKIKEVVYWFVKEVYDRLNKISN
ncbi:hypothetical protein [Dolichospermum heterosporum]|uniref:RiboL-PSP-HEPN domain-containing protein n=1 Tax=Dolichospermum heterosporum TAC447 TaxID=747523 RepID=A0ABY5M2A1_9CYAN|nr:hypothetical protein [Dolichospermum heterosporum]UUO15944.1 hypothetical protein NG743_02485 [Dolichospermum heterosporum TAC447]